MTNQKQFGVWMDSHHATVVEHNGGEPGEWVVLAHVKGEEVSGSSSNKNESNQKDMLRGKFFKEVAHHLQNATHLHATGTGQVQEQFMHYLAATPQFKNVQAKESTSNKMSDEALVKFFSGALN